MSCYDLCGNLDAFSSFFFSFPLLFILFIVVFVSTLRFVLITYVSPLIENLKENAMLCYFVLSHVVLYTQSAKD